MLSDDERSSLFPKYLERSGVLLMKLEGGIKKNDVRIAMRKILEGTSVQDFSPFLELQRGYVFPDQIHRCFAPFDEDYPSGAAAKRFNADCAGSRVGIQEGLSRKTRLQDIKQSFTQTVGRGTSLQPRQSFYNPTAELARDDSHVTQLVPSRTGAANDLV